MIHFDKKVVVVYLFALKRIVRGTLDGISVGSSSARNEIGNATVLMTFVVMHVSGEDDEAGANVGLAIFEDPCEVLLG